MTGTRGPVAVGFVVPTVPNVHGLVNGIAQIA
jgi:hypothetical protein